MNLFRKSMCRFIETLRVQDGKVMNIDYHQKRMDDTFSHFFNKVNVTTLADIAPECHSQGTYKWRVVYGRDGIVENSCCEYVMKNVRNLRLVDGGDIDYHFKSDDRNELNKLTAESRGCDNVIIVKDGLLTDTSYTNIALFDGNRWVTPKTPLLAGTKRAELLDKGIVGLGDIHVEEVNKYKYISMFNAMIDFKKITLDIKDVLM